jgi:flagellar biosynthesis protein
MKKDKSPKAVALRYHHGQDQAPSVVAKGRGNVAQNIIALAREHQVPLVEDQQLVEMLEALDVDTEIPDTLYRAVAEVLVFVYRLNSAQSQVG